MEPEAGVREYRNGEQIPGTGYKYVATIGRGGQGLVYQVYSPFFDQMQAMKLGPPLEIGASAEAADEQRREARVMRKLQSQYIAMVFDGGITAEEPQRAYFTMELLAGLALSSLLRQSENHRLSMRVSIVTAIEVLHGLKVAHANKVIHRDIKPSNIWISPSMDGQSYTKLLDFGISKTPDPKRNTGHFFSGTHGYAAPEQYGGQVSPQSDLYALACVLFEMATGRPVFRASKAADLIRLHRFERAPRMSSVIPNVPEALDQLIAAALEKDPAKRPESAADFGRLLQAVHDVLAITYQNERTTDPKTTERTPLSKLIVAAEKSEAREKDFRTGSLADVEASGAYPLPPQVASPAAHPASVVDPVARTKRDPQRTMPMSPNVNVPRAHDATKRAPYAPGADVQEPPRSLSPTTSPPPPDTFQPRRPNFDTQPEPRSNLADPVPVATAPLIAPAQAFDSVTPSTRSPHPRARLAVGEALRKLWRGRIRPPSKLEVAIVAAALIVVALGMVTIGVLLPPAAGRTVALAKPAEPAPMLSAKTEATPPPASPEPSQPSATVAPTATVVTAATQAPLATTARAAPSAKAPAPKGPPPNPHMCLKDGYIYDLHRSCAEMERANKAAKTGFPPVDF